MVSRGKKVQTEKLGQNLKAFPGKLVIAHPGNFPILIVFSCVVEKQVKHRMTKDGQSRFQTHLISNRRDSTKHR